MLKKIELPLVTVILPIYNGEKYLSKSIRSILAQKYNNIELIIINDGSTDNSQDIINRFKNDGRITALHQDNAGLAATLNKGIKISRGKYIARQDQDDVSMPSRIRDQVNFLESHKDYAMVGSWAKILSGDRKTKRTHRHPSENLQLKFSLLFGNPFVHSSIMLRRDVLNQIGLYSSNPLNQPEDYELWSRISRKYKISNISKFLVLYRETPLSMSRSTINPFKKGVYKISYENITHLLKRRVKSESIIDLINLIHHNYEKLNNYIDFRQIKHTVNQLARIIKQNEKESAENNLQLDRFVRFFLDKNKRHYLCQKNQIYKYYYFLKNAIHL